MLRHEWHHVLYDRGKKSSVAFTLAEVLITLTIIGVIAALTIPNLMRNMQEHAWHQQWKDDFAILQNAYKLVSAEYPDMQIVSYATSSYNSEFTNALLSNLKVVDSCIPGRCNNNWCPLKYNTITTYKTLKGGDYTHFEDGRQKAVLLKNGSIIYFGHMHVPSIIVDVNGKKGPNIIGKDVYGAAFDDTFNTGYARYTNSLLIPYGTPSAKDGRIKQKLGSCDNPNAFSDGLRQFNNDTGSDCSYKYLYEK